MTKNTSFSTSTSSSSTPQSQTPQSHTPQIRTPSERHVTFTPESWTTVEHRLENNWNGLLLNDYFNCDSEAAAALFASERDELSLAAPRPSTKKVQTSQEKAREAVEHRLEENWNGLLLNDWMNCDSGAGMDLWAEERRQLAEVEKKSAEEGLKNWSSSNTGI
jgi:hypothetical protein